MPIPADDTSPTELSDIEAEDALLASLMPPKGGAKAKAPTASDPDEDEEGEEDADAERDDGGAEDEEGEEDADADEDSDEDEEGEEDADEDESADDQPQDLKAPSDDAVVKVTVDGVETEVTVGSLKRLAGQEASLTKKSQEADLVGGRAALMIQGALAAVAEDLEPYENVDWVLLSSQLDPEEFQWHRENFVRHQTRLNSLVEQAGKFEEMANERAATTRKAQAEEAVVELKRDIPEWSEKLYTEIMDFAVKAGLPEDDVANIANAKILKLLHQAMLYSKGSKIVAEKVKMAPKRVKSGNSGAAPLAEASSLKVRKLEKLVKSGRGTDQNAIDLLVGRWGL